MKTIFTLVGFLFYTYFLQAQTSNIVIFSEDGQQFYAILNGIRQNTTAETNVKITGIKTGSPCNLKIIFADQKIKPVSKNFPMQSNMESGDVEITFKMKMAKKGMVLRYFGEVPLSQSQSGVPTYSYTTVEGSNNYVSTNTNSTTNVNTNNNTEQVNVNTNTNVGGVGTTTTVQTTETTTVTNTNGVNSNVGMNVGGTNTNVNTGVNTNSGTNSESVNVNMNVGGVGLNMNVNVSGTGSSTGSSSETQYNNTNMFNSGTNNGSTTTTYTETVTTTTTTNTNTGTNYNSNTNIGTTGNTSTGTNTTVGTSTNCYTPMGTTDFSSMKKSISSKSFADSKMQVAQQATKGSCLTALQIKEVMELFDYEENRLDYAKFAYAYCVDKNNYYKVNDAFKFESSIEELNAFIK